MISEKIQIQSDKKLTFTLDYNYLGPKHSKFLVHVFGENWLCSSVILNLKIRYYKMQ